MKALAFKSAFFLAAASFCAQPALAANGIHLIGLSPESVSMGGTGVSHCTNATDAIYKNPACLTQLAAKDHSLTGDLSATYITLNSTVSSSNGGVAGPTTINNAGGNILPQLTASYRLNDSWAFGLGLLVYGGANIDYSANAALGNITVYNQVSRIAPTASYKYEKFNIGVSPLIEYGQLQVNESFITSVQSARAPHSATGFGVQAGASYQALETLNVAVSYTSKSNLNYKQIADLDKLALSPVLNTGLDDFQVQHPQEFAAGVTWVPMVPWKFSFDYRNIGWSDASTYADLGWAAQNVFAVGAEYSLKDWAFRGGFNYATSPVDSGTTQNGDAPVQFQGHTIRQYSLDVLDTAAFPAFSQSHITLGAQYQPTNDLVVSLAGLFSPKVVVTRSGTATQLVNGNPVNNIPYTLAASMVQWQINAGVTYKF